MISAGYEPLINLVGKSESIAEAMDIVDIDRVLVFNDDSRINSIIYDKNNSWTEVIVDYDVNSFITIRTIVRNGVTLNEIVERYIEFNNSLKLYCKSSWYKSIWTTKK